MMCDSKNSSVHLSPPKPQPPAQIHSNKNHRNQRQTSNIDKTHDFFSPFRIATLNVRGLNTKAKQALLIDYIKDNNIQILGVSETNLNEKASRLIYDRNRIYHAYFAATDEQPRGAGVGIIITKQYNKYVRKSNSYQGRAVYIDLYIRGKQNIRIIQTYVHANHKDCSKTEKL